MSFIKRLWINLYLPEIFKGMWCTIKRFFYYFFAGRFTIKYPEQKKPRAKGFRGLHKLKRDEKGRVKCVACFMCATACPSRCIKIVAQPIPYEDKEKEPEIFEIDMLRCIWCGMCQEACPNDAIEMTPVHPPPFKTRKDGLWNMDKLLS
jgi:NADH-quinone oxidoreductase subunit I